jgi:geranylgeranyl diphosphate synthase type I
MGLRLWWANLSLQDELKRIAYEVNTYISDRVKGEPPYLYDASLHLIKAGGKRLRPFMTLKFHGLYSQDERAALPAAAALELVHNFTLIHDDIMDRDDMRHGVPTVHIKFGEPLAILAGDVLFAEAFRMVAETPAFQGDFHRANSAVRLLAGSLIALCEGQALDVRTAEGGMFSEGQYYEIIEKKTAALFEASAVMGVLTGGGGEQDVKHARLYARNVGMAFQMVDDLLGVVGDASVTGKPVGGDLKEGKKTLPIFLSVQRSRPEERELLMRVWGNPRANQEDVEKATQVLKALGIDSEVRAMAQKRVEEALEHLAFLPSRGGNWLVRLANFVIERKI